MIERSRHSNLSITDGVYGVLSDNDVGERIGSLGERNVDASSLSRSELKDLLYKVAENL
jgi:hypothetical protein